MILCNGSPKTGTHLLLKAAHQLGGRCVLAVHRHDADIDSLNHRHIHIIREPRNAFISYLRMNKLGEDYSEIAKHVSPFIKEYSSYIHYLSDPKTLNIRFERLLADKSEYDKIALFLSKEVVDYNIIGGTATYNKTPSCYKEIFDDKIKYAWEFFGGKELSINLGYDYE